MIDSAGIHAEAHVTVYGDPDYYCGPGPAVVCDPDGGRLTVAFPSGAIVAQRRPFRRRVVPCASRSR